ncbi:hypothetical protein T492DRAFT_891907, partial [Pavlovales sp. CCMP2436]
MRTTQSRACLGLRRFLVILPLFHAESGVRLAGSKSNEKEDTTFLLPLLSHFVSQLLPFADGLANAARANVSEDGNPSVLGRTCQLLCLQ